MRKISLFLLICILLPVSAFAQSNSTFDDDFDDPFSDESESVDLSYKIADPLEPLNRAIFYINDKFYTYAFIPVIRGYGKVVPSCVRQGISNVFDNLDSPLTFFSACFQGEFSKAWVTLKRFTINTTLGVAGIFDPAEYIWGIEEPSDEDLGLTLGKYGVGHGFYIVIPFIGPSSARDLPTGFAGGYLQPYEYILDDFIETMGVDTGKMVNKESFSPDRYLNMKKGSLDPYVAFKDIYVKYRNKKATK